MDEINAIEMEIGLDNDKRTCNQLLHVGCLARSFAENEKDKEDKELYFTLSAIDDICMSIVAKMRKQITAKENEINEIRKK